MATVKNQVVVTWEEIRRDICSSQRLHEMLNNPAMGELTSVGRVVRLYGIPRGGIHAAQAIACYHKATDVRVEITSTVSNAHIIVDDLIDSGRTVAKYSRSGLPIFALYSKPQMKEKSGLDSLWVVFPWEIGGEEVGPTDAVRRLIQFIGDDPDRSGLLETPDRVLRSYAELFEGYKQSPAQLLKTFDNVPCDEIIMLDGVDVYSFCEHHMLPFVGKATVAYLPDGDTVVGLSKLARLVDVYARRLQVQERLTAQIVDALMEHLQPKGAACFIEARHFCVCSRGVNKQGSTMKTSSVRGVFRTDPSIRSEFFSMIKKG